MGARHAEFGIGLWMLLSPVLFGHTSGALLWHDLACGAVLSLVPLLCYLPALRRAHLALLALALWLIGYGWWATRGGATPASQNHVLVGLLLAMTAVVPSRAAEPPDGWRRYQDASSGNSQRRTTR